MAYIRRQNGQYIPTEYFHRYIPTVSPTGYIVCLEICNGVVTSDDFTDKITEGFKLRYPYSDVALSPMESPTEAIRRWFHRKKTIIYPLICRHSLPLFLLLLLSHPTSSLPNYSHTHPNSPLFSTQTLNIRTWLQYPFLVDFILFL
jgi:hypothetical protein